MEEKKEYLWKVKWIGVLLLLLLLISITKNVKAAERFLWPVPNYTNVYQSYSSEHQGIDISQGGIAGKPVVATKSGVVVAAKDTCNCGDPYTPCNCNGRQGNYVIIKHNDGGFSRYLHLQYGSVSVQVGQSVNRGAKIGLVGSSGESYGYHLHFDLATGSAWNLNNRYNPMNESYDYNTTPQPTEKPTNVVIELEKNAFFSNEHVTYYCAGNGVSYYVISIYNSQGNVIETAKINPGEYCTRYYEPGNYMAYCEAYNALGNTFSNTVKFTVKAPEKPTDVAIALEKTVFLTTDHVTYYCTGNNVSYFIISIYDAQGNVVETAKINPGEYCTRYYEPGNYMAYCEAYNALGNTFSNTVKFTVKSSAEIDKPHQHVYASNIKKLATCTEPGIRLYTCKDNDDSYEEEIPATGHQHTELRNVKQATCAHAGYTGDTYCKDCNAKLSSGKTIAKKAHTWDAGKITKQATCTVNGTKTYTCTICKTTKTSNIAATGHAKELRNVKTATCAHAGYTGDTYCKKCNKKLATGKTIAQKAHTWNKGVVTTAATCTKQGVRTYTCTVCKGTRKAAIAATGHRNKVLKNARRATCAKAGYTGDTYCKDCNAKLSSGKTIAKKAHTWDAGKVTKKATCTVKGTKTYTCKICKATKTSSIAATGHRHTELRNVKKATCGQEGYTGDTYCKDCKAKVSSGKVIAKTPHKNKIVKFAKESTCKSEGYTGDIFCYDCGSLIEEGAVIDKLEHIWDSGKITVQPTAAKTGVRTYTCENCGATKKTTIPVLNLAGKTIQDKTTNGVYKVLSSTSVEYTKPIAKRAAVNIPATVKLSGKTFNVTKISANAFRNNTVMKSLTIGSNVTTIGANAFYGCKNLNTVIIKTAKLTSKTVGTNAFAKTGAKPVVTVPAKQFNTYKTLLRSKGISTKAVYKK